MYIGSPNGETIVIPFGQCGVKTHLPVQKIGLRSRYSPNRVIKVPPSTTHRVRRRRVARIKQLKTVLRGSSGVFARKKDMEARHWQYSSCSDILNLA